MENPAHASGIDAREGTHPRVPRFLADCLAAARTFVLGRPSASGGGHRDAPSIRQHRKTVNDHASLLESDYVVLLSPIHGSQALGSVLADTIAGPGPVHKGALAPAAVVTIATRGFPCLYTRKTIGVGIQPGAFCGRRPPVRGVPAARAAGLGVRPREPLRLTESGRWKR